jgi:hypothetical protein
MSKHALARLVTFVCLFSLAGCGGGGIGSVLGGGGGDCSPHNFTLNFPSVAGYAASGQITSATACFSSATVHTYAATSPIFGTAFTSSDPSTQVLLYLGISFSANEYASGLPALTVSLPSGTPTSGQKFYLAYNGGGGAFGWAAAAEGPATVSGSTLTFASGYGNTTFDANQQAEFAVYSVASP